MPRFNSDRYTTAQDSSPGWKTYKPEFVVLQIEVDEHREGCPCGCGTWPLGAKAKFAMGHDARLRGILIRAHMMGKQVLYVMIDKRSRRATDAAPTDAREVAEQHGWTKYLDEAVLRREGKNREVLQKALGSKRLLTVGRSNFTGQVMAVYRGEKNVDMCEIEYVNRAGEVKRARQPLEDTEEVAA